MRPTGNPTRPGTGAEGPKLLVDLRELLPIVARLTDGNVQLLDGAGNLVHRFEEKGAEAAPDKEVSALARRAWTEGRPVAGSSEAEQCDAVVAAPIGDYVLVVSGLDRAKRELELWRCMEAALPLIAKVAGGEAALFDRDGRFLTGVLPNGLPDAEAPGRVYESCRRAMTTGRPDVGPSHLLPGAMAVRIPLSRDLGFGFNNSSAVQKGQELLKEVSRVRSARYTWEDIIGESEPLRAAVQIASRAAATQSPVWIFGESGTGKELFAQAIHNGSVRRGNPFVAVNCAALPSSLIESTLFGYTEGAFTGAKRQGQAGLFEQAEGGTLLLDEISEMDLNLQAKLLRVLQEKEVTRVGASKSIPVDVRIICTSNRDLRKLAESGDFREDLFYRLNVMDVRTPPLRERRDDIPLLANFLVSRLSLQVGRLINCIDPAALRRLREYDWPGNIRELQNSLERAMNMVEGDTIFVRHLPPTLTEPKQLGLQAKSLAERLKEMEATILRETIDECGGNKAEAARKLEISYMTLWRKLPSSNPHGPARRSRRTGVSEHSPR